MNNSREIINELSLISNDARRLIIDTVYEVKAGHMGGPLSAVEVLVSLYNQIMNINPEQPKWEDRDRFILSKGHSAIGLYAILALRGYFPIEEMKTFDGMNSRLQAHPDKLKLPGLDMSTGSLGQGISTAVGMALGAKLRGKQFYTYCMIGDGEAQEGQVWEAANVARNYELDNLVVIIDYNKLQQYGWAGQNGSRKNPINSLHQKWEAFGWHVLDIDGHSIDEILESFEKAKANRNKPTIIISNTIKGKGISFMENKFKWHSNVPSDEEYKTAINELEAERIGG